MSNPHSQDDSRADREGASRRSGADADAAARLEQIGRLERELADARHHARQLRQIIDLVPDFLYAVDAQGRYLVANEALAREYRLSVDEVCGRRASDIARVAGIAERILEADREVLRTGEPSFTPEFETTDPDDGRRRVLQIRRIPYRDELTGQSAVLGVATEITEQKRIQEQLASARHRLQDTIESMGDGFMLYDAEERLVTTNARVTELARAFEPVLRIGDRFENMLRRLFESDNHPVLHGFDSSDRVGMIEERMRLFREAPSTHEQRMPDGREILVSTRPTSDGGRVVAYTDVTDRKAAERALHEKERMEHDLDIARAIQHGLLPDTTPDLPQFEIAGWNRAADRTGGDYFDWLTLPDGRIVVVVADVTGHGIGPALLVAVCRAYFRASSLVEDNLQAILSRVNDLLARDLTHGRFVTAAVGLLDAGTTRMQLYSAGHGPLFFYRAAEDRVLSWPADDIPLGIVAGPATGSAREIRFEPNDTLVLTTDGFHEWANPCGERFGEERLAEAVRRHHRLAPQALIATLYREVTAHAGAAEQTDDLTAVVVKRV